jgi:hypothetical protein
MCRDEFRDLAAAFFCPAKKARCRPDSETGGGMTEKSAFKDLEALMAEADELIQKINSDAAIDAEEVHRLELEKQARKLEKIKSELSVSGHANPEKSSDISGSAEGMHEAIEDIVKAMQDLKRKIF